MGFTWMFVRQHMSKSVERLIHLVDLLSLFGHRCMMIHASALRFNKTWHGTDPLRKTFSRHEGYRYIDFDAPIYPLFNPWDLRGKNHNFYGNPSIERHPCDLMFFVTAMVQGFYATYLQHQRLHHHIESKSKHLGQICWGSDMLWAQKSW